MVELVPAKDVHVVEGGAREILRMRQKNARDLPGRAFAVPVTGSKAGQHRWRVFTRQRFLALLRKVRAAPAKEADVGLVERVFGLDKEPAPTVGRDERPRGPAVVLQPRFAGCWIVARERRAADDGHLSHSAPVGSTDRFVRAVARRTTFLAPGPPGYYMARRAGPLEPVLSEMMVGADMVATAGASLGDEVAETVRVADETLRRTPHIDIADDPPLQPGTTYDVEVYVDEAAPRPFERSEDVIVAAPADQERFELDVALLVSEHFEMEGDGFGTLAIDRGRPESDRLGFRVTVREELGLDLGPPSIGALLMYARRPAGRVTREVRIAGAQPPPAPEAPAQDGAASVQTLAGQPDLTVIVTRSAAAQPYECIVTSSLLESFRSPSRESWGYRDGAESLVTQRMAGFTDAKASPARRLAALRGAGLNLFEDAPRNFQQAVTELVARDGVHSILIATEEPVMPWELLIPPGQDAPIGVTQRVGRWTHPQQLPPRQDIRVVDAQVFVPHYANEKRRLSHADAEAELLCSRLPAERAKPVTFDRLSELWRDHVPTLLHFVCHGAAGTGVAETIYLDADETFDSELLRGMGVDAGFRESEPIVFLNACEVGRAIPGLVGSQSFARSFAALGARGVIAPLWKVKDSLALEVARKVYEDALADPERPIAETMREIRGRTYAGEGHEDSYAAYCWYGDPLATLRT